MPRPEWRLFPEPSPRPTRLRVFWLWAGFSVVRFSRSAILDPHQVAHLAQHACEHRRLVVLHGLADLAQAERAERAAVLLRLADLATRLCDSNLCHLRLGVCRGNLPVPPNPLRWSAFADGRLRSRLRRLLHRRPLVG